jgi:hypothetical protein
MIIVGDYLYTVGYRLGFDTTANHSMKAVAALCFELNNRIQKRLIGEVKKVYKVKLKPAEIESILYLKNDYAPNIHPNTENAIIRLLQQQKSNLC